MTEPIPWYVRRPGLLAAELEELAAAYPELRQCSLTQKLGGLILHGEIVVRSQKGARRQQLLLSYPNDFDYSPPTILPLKTSGAFAEPHDENIGAEIQWFSFRHQMADGALCLYQRDTGHARVTGVDALRRAERWLHEFETGALSPELDTIGAELEEHYRRHGLIIAGPEILDGATSAHGRLAAVQIGDEEHLRYVLTHAKAGGQPLTEQKVLGPFLQMWCGADAEEIWKADLERLADLARDEPHRLWSGEYLTLDREPPIIRDAQTLAQLLYPNEEDPIAALTTAYGRALAADAGLILALRYPARQHGGFDWLFLRLRLRAKALERETVPGMGGVSGVILDITSTRDDMLRRAEIGVLSLEDVRRSALQVRNVGRVPQDASTLSVAMFGVGALGSVAADLFAKSGLGKVALCDPQTLRAGNALRHVGGLHRIGEKKVQVVAQDILTHNPYCESPLADCSALALKPEVFRQTTCIVSTIANDATELALNERVMDAGATLYILRAQRAGTVGRLIRVRPRVDACFECVQHHYADGFTHLIIPPQEGETVAHECGSPVLAASAADLTAVAAIGVRRILDDLAAPSATNHWLWTIAGVPDVPGLDRPLAEVRDVLPPHRDCQTCAPSPVVEIVLDARIHDFIERQARERFPNETGGILVGHIRGDVVHVTAASDSGPAAAESPSGFLRDGKHCQTFLEDAMTASDGAVTYVGEWHSHPQHGAMPSHTDVTSLAEISTDQNFNTPAPVMLIVALETAEGSPILHGSVYPAHRRGFVVPVRAA